MYVIRNFKGAKYKARTKFTWLPKQLDDGHKAFLSFYIAIEKLYYPHQDLPLHIEVPNQPIWIEIYSMALPDIPVVDTRSILEVELEEYIEKLKTKNKEK